MVPVLSAFCVSCASLVCGGDGACAPEIQMVLPLPPPPPPALWGSQGAASTGGGTPSVPVATPHLQGGSPEMWSHTGGNPWSVWKTCSWSQRASKPPSLESQWPDLPSGHPAPRLQLHTGRDTVVSAQPGYTHCRCSRPSLTWTLITKSLGVVLLVFLVFLPHYSSSHTITTASFQGHSDQSE